MPETASISRPWSDTSWLKQLERSCRRWQLTWLQLVLRGELHLGMHLGFCDPRRSHVTPKRGIVWGTGPVYSSQGRGRFGCDWGCGFWCPIWDQPIRLGQGRSGGVVSAFRQAKKSPNEGAFSDVVVIFHRKGA